MIKLPHKTIDSKRRVYMLEVENLFGIIAALFGISGISLVYVVTKIKENKKLILNEDNGLYYKKGDNKNPYCPKCYENKRKKILLEKDPRMCPECKAVFERPPVVTIAHPINRRPLPKVF
jgi:hypothetical protein